MSFISIQSSNSPNHYHNTSGQWDGHSLGIHNIVNVHLLRSGLLFAIPACGGLRVCRQGTIIRTVGVLVVKEIA